jgi:hypothetical protein
VSFLSSCKRFEGEKIKLEKKDINIDLLQAIQDMKEGKFDYHTPLPPALVQITKSICKD